MALVQAISVIRKSACIKLIWMYCLGTEEESACERVCCQVNESENQISRQIREPDELLIKTKQQRCLVHVANSRIC